MVRKKNRIEKLVILTMVLVLLICVIPKTFSKYESDMSGVAEVETAFYVIATDYQYQTIALPTIVPRDEPYVYTFSVANNKDGKRLETRLEYNLSIRTTTNLPLTYELYKNDSDVSIKVSDDVMADDDGTYFRYITTNREFFSYLYDEVNYYTLVVNFSKEFMDFNYQDIADVIEITIDSKQILSGE